MVITSKNIKDFSLLVDHFNKYKAFDPSRFRLEGEDLKVNSFFRRAFFFSYHKSPHSEKMRRHFTGLIRLINAQDYGDLEHRIEGVFRKAHFSAQVHRYNQINSEGAFPLIEMANLPLQLRRFSTENDRVDVVGVDVPEPLHQGGWWEKLTGARRYPGDVSGAYHLFIEAPRIGFRTQCEKIKAWFAPKKFGYDRNGGAERQVRLGGTLPTPWVEKSGPESWFMGHASLFLQIPIKAVSGDHTRVFSVMTDPVEGGITGFPRQTKDVALVDSIPIPDVLTITHNHMDHLDEKTLRKWGSLPLSAQPTVFVPQGERARFLKMGFSSEKIISMDWWREREVTFQRDGKEYKLRIIGTPSRHWSGTPTGGFSSAYLGYIFLGGEGGGIYFSGDTAVLSDAHTRRLRDLFSQRGVKFYFGPGGPDGTPTDREDLKTSHVSSSETLAQYMEFFFNLEGCNTWEDFKIDARGKKLLAIHTMTLKMGTTFRNETRESWSRLLRALEISSDRGLISYEKGPFSKLNRFITDAQDKYQSDAPVEQIRREFVQLLRETIVIPKIGSAITLTGSKESQQEKTCDLLLPPAAL